MKSLFKLLVIVLFATGSILTTNIAKSQVTASVSFSIFHDNLRPYGRWIHHARYGEVWIPNVHGFRPYSTGGHWAYTDYGWTWVSDYDWGWAPFHYGRWAYESSYGWIWVPGYEWGPSWVSWRTGGDYYGWAPLTPDVNIGVGVNFGTSLPADYWVFTPTRYITSPLVFHYYVPRTQNVTIIKRTTIINNTREANFSNHKIVVVGGPRREDVEKVVHTKVTVMHVNESSKPGRETVDRSKNTINVYRPVINKTTINKTVVNNNNNEVNKTTVNNNKTVNSKETNSNKEVNKTTANQSATANKKPADKTVNKDQQAQKKPGTQNSSNNNTKKTKPGTKKPESNPKDSSKSNSKPN